MIEIDSELLRGYLLQRKNDSHKGDYGHALLVCGCERMPGAAVLATGAALKSGCGLVTLHSTSTARTAAMSRFPSAMLSPEPEEIITSIPYDPGRYSAVGIGPGLGKDKRTADALHNCLRESQGGLVLDADALNIISENPEMIDLIPRNAVLTPHLGELKRLMAAYSERYGATTDDDMPISFCRKTGCIMVVKGPGTRIYTGEEIYVNTTGNPGLAKGGSGDVLTGLLTGLIARGYKPEKAAILAVWLHGFAADRLTSERTAECYSSMDLIDCLHEGFVHLYRNE